MPVLSWSLRCQPESIQGGADSPVPVGQTGFVMRGPPPTIRPRSEETTTLSNGTRNTPRTLSRKPQRAGCHDKHICVLFNLARSAEGPPAGEVRARSTRRLNPEVLAQSCPPKDPRPASREGPTGPTLRANPCPEVTDPDCRFPLPTLIYRLEAPNLGDQMRRWVRSVSKQGRRPRGFRAAGPPQPKPGQSASCPPRRFYDPCDYLTCIFHGPALVHGTTQELCRSTATVWFVKPASPSRFK